MNRLLVLITALVCAVSPSFAGTSAPTELKDLYYGEALYLAFQFLNRFYCYFFHDIYPF